MSRTIIRLLVLAILASPAVVRAQGILIVTDPDQQIRLPRPIIILPPEHWPHPRPIPVPRPRPPVSYKIKELDIHARLIDQVAQVQVSQTFVNSGSLPMEVAFVFPLPYDGAVEQMTLMIDGKEYPAKLLDAGEARRMYEEIVRKNRDPALLEWMGTGLFKTSVFPVPAGASRTVSLRYSQLCRKQEGLTDFLFPLSTAKYTSDAVEKVDINISIESQDEIKNVYSPTHAIEIKRPDQQHATIVYSGKNEVPSSDFRLFYDVGKGMLGTRVLSYRPEKEKEGFFLLLASPEIKAEVGKMETGSDNPSGKTVIFVIDRSGSMSGKKIEQVQAALKYVLNNLHQGDLFNVIAYDDQIQSFRPELQRFDEDTRKAALGFVAGLYAGGSTNIDAALRTALGQIQDARRPSYIVFLTDGIPTAGETNEMKIALDARQENKHHARIFAFGVGYDVNSRLLDKIVRENFGQSEFVRPNEDIEDRVSRLYNRLESPVMTGVNIQFVSDEMKSEEGSLVNRVYPKDEMDLFAGEQLVLVGRYKKPGTAKVIIQGTIGQKQEKFDFPAVFVDKSGDESFAFIEKLWAVRRVGEILDELDLKGKNNELVKELVELATRHGILTPYTSFMANENVNLHDVAANAGWADRRLGALDVSDGNAGFAQRAMKGGMQRVAQASAPSSGGSFGYGAQPAEVHEALSVLNSSPAFQSGGVAGAAYAGNADKELADVAQNIRNVGNRTFYQRSGRWIDSLLSTDQESNAKRIKQFSDEYFELARRHGRTLSQYMVFDEPVLLNLDNQAYLIEP
ncbi:MAG: VIT and VWA domain-containing protein [Thermoguttaceae bacterium]|jgi:Ca-activated chloride channel family protein